MDILYGNSYDREWLLELCIGVGAGVKGLDVGVGLWENTEVGKGVMVDACIGYGIYGQGDGQRIWYMDICLIGSNY